MPLKTGANKYVCIFPIEKAYSAFHHREKVTLRAKNIENDLNNPVTQKLIYCLSKIPI